MVNIKKTLVLSFLVFTILLGCAACSGGVSGSIEVDGSSTVYPVSEAVAEEFRAVNSGIVTNIGKSGTGGGMKKFINGEIDICDASRPIKETEIEDAKKNGIEYIELLVAYDGISVVVNKDNTWIHSITVEDLKRIWEENSTVRKWSDVKPEWPNQEIKLYGPGTDSGTFEYFTEAINHKAFSIRTDFTPNEDDNVLVTGVVNDNNAMGYFGYSYYIENKDRLKVLPIDAGNGPVAPDFVTIEDGTYKPLSRPLFIYVNKESLEKKHVKEFVKFYLTEGTKLIQDVGYVPLNDEAYNAQLSKIE